MQIISANDFKFKKQALTLWVGIANIRLVLDSSVVQSVERRTVNPYVTGSSPVRGAKFKKACFLAGFLLSNYQRS